MPQSGSQQKASLCGAFCVWAALLAALFFAVPGTACTLDRADETVRVEYVYDGDTVRLADGRKVRLIGVNTPELNPREGRPEPLADAARRAAERLVREAEVVHLRFDRERRDAHGRVLAHLFLPDGRSLSRSLIAAGLGTAIAVPPNLWNLACYRAAERQAQAAGLGIWALPGYAPRRAREFRPDEEGFRLIRGRVVRVGESRRSLWLNLDGPVAVRIARADLDYFGGAGTVRALAGKEVVVRGWVRPHNRNGESTVRVRHPAAVHVLD